MHNLLPLPAQIGQRVASNILRLERDPLAIPQPSRAPVQPVRPAQQLLPLLQLLVARAALGVIAVAGTEEGFAVGGEGREFAFLTVHVCVPVAETLVDLAFLRCGDVFFLDAHLIQLYPHTHTPVNTHSSRKGGVGFFKTYEFVGFLEGALGLPYSGFTGLAREFGDLVELLV